ncbi:MAG: hypothetical protein GVY18_16800 [Bacteroidetes bacterium]|nr:hypothetical protein [Bacteroidota bacterium]
MRTTLRALAIGVLLGTLGRTPVSAQPDTSASEAAVQMLREARGEEERVLSVRVDRAGAATEFVQIGNRLARYGPDGRQSVPLGGALVHSVTSSTGRFLGLLTEPDATDQPDARALRLLVVRHDGALRYTHVLPRTPDAPRPVLAVSDRTGAVAYGDPARGEVVLLDGDGREVARVRLFEEAPYTLERTLLLSFSPDGRHLAVAAMREAARPGAVLTDNVRIWLYRTDGTVRWRRTVPEPALHALAVSPAADRVAVATLDAYADGGMVRRTRFFAGDGTPQGTLPMLFARASFAEDRPLVWLASARQVIGYDLATRRTLFTEAVESTPIRVLDVALHPDGTQGLVLQGAPRFEGGRFVVRDLQARYLNSDGALLGRLVLDDAVGPAPRLAVMPSGVVFASRSSAALFSWIRP